MAILYDNWGSNVFYDLHLKVRYKIISPDPWLRPYMDDYHRLADLFSLLRVAYESKDPMRRELARKTAELIREHTRQGLIEQVVDVFEVTPETLAQIAASNQPDAVKVINLVRVINWLVQTQWREAPLPHFYRGAGGVDWRGLQEWSAVGKGDLRASPPTDRGD